MGTKTCRLIFLFPPDGDGSGLFMQHSAVGTRQFTDPSATIDAATTLARQAAIDTVVAMGAGDPQVQVSIRKQMLPNAVSDSELLEAVVVAEAIGRPNAAR